MALAIFRYQAKNNLVYKEYLEHLRKDANTILSIYEIPFLPISLFKSHKIISGEDKAEIIFTSSGTTGMVQSRHYVTDQQVYLDSFVKAFEFFYGDPKEFCFLALLPSYLEREGSSLILMVEELIKLSNHPKSGFFLYEHEQLKQTLEELESKQQKTILIGVTYALLDFIEEFNMQLKHTTVMETGGMKGKRKEMVREELHQQLKSGLGVDAIHSEYGMTELLSQAYSKGEGVFECPPWMKIITRDTNDPLSLILTQQSGGINIIDLANINSCSFLATQDLGRVFENRSFEILGRFDNSDIRGCNLLVQ
ncbi:Acyl-protein synthetase, LuxE [Solitalea koreensis]|uniref:Acyl-protein synthetase, LuxE n=2 Tax=Solitalea koreensis TaxID=543615 RepID=A0A521E545_9SPHI|nr:Acyl-protein synthetase, LuxE [Solitalea koreensis]